MPISAKGLSFKPIAHGVRGGYLLDADGDVIAFKIPQDFPVRHKEGPSWASAGPLAALLSYEATGRVMPVHSTAWRLYEGPNPTGVVVLKCDGHWWAHNLPVSREVLDDKRECDLTDHPLWSEFKGLFWLVSDAMMATPARLREERIALGAADRDDPKGFQSAAWEFWSAIPKHRRDVMK